MKQNIAKKTLLIFFLVLEQIQTTLCISIYKATKLKFTNQKRNPANAQDASAMVAQVPIANNSYVLTVAKITHKRMSEGKHNSS